MDHRVLDKKDMRTAKEKWNDFVLENERLLTIIVVMACIAGALIGGFLLGGSSSNTDVLIQQTV